MPEIPEVEAFAYLAKKCLDKTITSIDIADKKVIQKIDSNIFKKGLIGQEFNSVERKGKYLILLLRPSKRKLIMHFGLTGFLVITKDDEKIRFSQVTFHFKKGGSLHWCDVRKFGKLWLVDSIDKVKSIADLGPDALSLSLQKFMQLSHASESKNIKAFLMDQSIIAGIGNEYSDEILFQAEVDPHHKVSDLSDEILKKIYKKMHIILKYAIQLRKKHVQDVTKNRLFSEEDSTIFKNSYLQAHRHTDMICPKNRNHMLKKAIIAGRSAYYCPKDQK
jgi:formamidopyrimidine-DNA glycosylase